MNSTASNLKNTPLPDQIEISIFGPGFGECVVMHLGEGRWIIVDSCMNREVRKPVALAYFDEIGIDPAHTVEFILATHWHDDHVSGIDQVVEACPKADFWCSDALRTTEFLALTDMELSRRDLKFTRGVGCMKRVIEHIGENIKFALSSMRIYQRGMTVPVEIWSLSPSQYENLLAKQNLAALLPQADGVQLRFSDRNPNHTAIVLAVLIGQDQIVLGADLEESGDPRLGWSAILANTQRPALSAKVFKIPHHGSETAHHSDTWTHLIASDPLTATTPYKKGALLPKNSDVLRILRFANLSFISKQQIYQRRKRRQNVVEKLVPKSLRRLANVPGQIRFRKQFDAADSEWNVALFEGAGLLRDFQAA